MNKHQHRQSAVADFMQSLEQLEELWGNEETETENIFDNGLKGADADETARPSGSLQRPNTEQLNSKASQPETNA
ncbi:hypothetical protein IQ260_13855 [Leptolyngbya cf. ectocarpi LEGE 11479]|uniref:Uncharacterized protein n=1 Tax=Leptolyngbya cf. ectocarpi LEGE 11479 TaxID=1828722 RepID=A0A928ZUK9_LEPEC|nr:hypothetical protein [Leptolyngbya ectocarpi]MBE9067738.1 hypothetical protein [Leptolyngbya cf. ectocarpi LEGE 11479]